VEEKAIAMHELSIVMNIVEIAEKETAKANAHAVEEIELDIGMLSTIELDAFEFAWEHAVKNTILEHSVKRINRVKGKARCSVCDTEFEITQLYEPCPFCDCYNHTVITGQELKLKRLVLN
jgi:hydrogenase nickel incorporation protein HypA/HybF